MTVPAETYVKFIEYGTEKAHKWPSRLILDSFAGGLWIGVFGHLFAGSIYADHTRAARFAGALTYGVIFSGVIIAIVFTGAELFTGNTMAMMICFLDKKCTLWDMWRVWLFSLIFNFVGAFTVAGFSHLSPTFNVGTESARILCQVSRGKLARGWGEAFLLGVGCNILLCLAVWHVIYCSDGAGKVLGALQCMCAFSLGTFEHLIANFHSQSLALFHGCSEIGLDDVILFNWFPVLLGNIVSGVGMTAIWWCCFHTLEKKPDRTVQKQLLVALASKIVADLEVRKVDQKVVGVEGDDSTLSPSTP